MKNCVIRSKLLYQGSGPKRQHDRRYSLFLGNFSPSFLLMSQLPFASWFSSLHFIWAWKQCELFTNRGSHRSGSSQTLNSTPSHRTKHKTWIVFRTNSCANANGKSFSPLPIPEKNANELRHSSKAKQNKAFAGSTEKPKFEAKDQFQCLYYSNFDFSKVMTISSL